MLDGLHEDMNKVISKPTVGDIEIINETDEEAAKKFWDNYTRRNDSIIVDLFVG